MIIFNKFTNTTPCKTTFMLKKWYGYTDIFFILLLAVVPLFVTFPYRVNIFLSWEGAYRISEGQLPFRDFGTPLGGMYWVIPGIFFKIFGPQMVSLIKAQVFINIISGLAFRSILKSLDVHAGIRYISVLLYCISFSFFNFWPWYNHSVIVYEFIGLAFLFRYLSNATAPRALFFALLGGVFMFFSFMTKQDGGAMGFLIGAALAAYHAFTNKVWKGLLLYGTGFVALLVLVIATLGPNGFGYWFNHGQAPHSARVVPFDLLDEFFTGSEWIKFYLAIIFILMIPRFNRFKDWLNDKGEVMFFLLTMAILLEASVFQVTSYTPPDNNIFFHSFAFAFILYRLSKLALLDFAKPLTLFIGFAGLMLWWSEVYWKYIQRIAARALPPSEEVVSATGENVVNKKTYMIHPPAKDVPMEQWTFSKLKTLEKIYMPQPTVDGIERLMNMQVLKKQDPKVLNMSELTSLAAEVPFKLEKGSEYPLWYHLGVGMFNKQAALFESKISRKEYDLVLFEYIPTLNNFYPFRTRDSLKVHYQLVDSFLAPRRGDTQGMIEVYTK